MKANSLSTSTYPTPSTPNDLYKDLNKSDLWTLCEVPVDIMVPLRRDLYPRLQSHTSTDMQAAIAEVLLRDQANIHHPIKAHKHPTNAKQIETLDGHSITNQAKASGIQKVWAWVYNGTLADSQIVNLVLQWHQQVPWTELEIGVYVARNRDKLVAQGIKDKGLSAFGATRGISKQKMTVLCQAGEVFLSLTSESPFTFADFKKKTLHLAAIHKVPEKERATIVAELMEHKWSLDTLRNNIEARYSTKVLPTKKAYVPGPAWLADTPNDDLENTGCHDVGGVEIVNFESSTGTHAAETEPDPLHIAPPDLESHQEETTGFGSVVTDSEDIEDEPRAVSECLDIANITMPDDLPQGPDPDAQLEASWKNVLEMVPTLDDQKKRQMITALATACGIDIKFVEKSTGPLKQLAIVD